jgi:hypothetical protein
MSLIEFTSYDDIRAALGVSSDEIEDATLSLPLYEYRLIAELEDISLTLISEFGDLAVDSLTDVQKRLKQSVIVFSTYSVAVQLTSSLPLFSPKEISDGKAHTTRYALDPYKATTELVTAEYQTARTRLLSAYGAFKSSTTTTTYRTYISSAPANYDPVTGE